MKQWMTLVLFLFGCDCDPRNTSTVRECQDKCGSLADACVKRTDVQANTCIDAFARCVAACGGDLPKTAEAPQTTKQ